MQRKPSPEFAKIIETPNHFYFGPVELSYVVSDSTKVEKFGDNKFYYPKKITSFQNKPTKKNDGFNILFYKSFTC